MVSYKAPWDVTVALRTLEQTGMYEASANLLWLNPFPVSTTAQHISGDPPQWKTVCDAADKFMTLEAGEERSLASSQGALGHKIARLLFPITVPARCDRAADGGSTRVLGNFDVVSGHVYVWAWYLSMHSAMVRRDAPLVVALWQMALTTSVHLRHGLTESQQAVWSISHAEQARFADGVMGDTFPAFALKCLAVLEVTPLCHRGALSSDGVEAIAVRKAHGNLLEANAIFRGARSTSPWRAQF